MEHGAGPDTSRTQMSFLPLCIPIYDMSFFFFKSHTYLYVTNTDMPRTDMSFCFNPIHYYIRYRVYLSFAFNHIVKYIWYIPICHVPIWASFLIIYITIYIIYILICQVPIWASFGRGPARRIRFGSTLYFWWARRLRRALVRGPSLPSSNISVDSGTCLV